MESIPETVLKWRDLAAMAKAFRFQPALVLAVIWTESGGDQCAWNPEPAYRYLWNVRTNAPFRALTPGESASESPPSDFPFLAGDRDQEWWAQQASWGLMQPMGAVARECGFKGPYLTRLVQDPELNLQIGCTHLRKQLDAAGNVRDALRRYNGGPGNMDYSYADDVIRKIAEVTSG
jgi:hypothetical protein